MNCHVTPESGVQVTSGTSSFSPPLPLATISILLWMNAAELAKLIISSPGTPGTAAEVAARSASTSARNCPARNPPVPDGQADDDSRTLAR